MFGFVGSHLLHSHNPPPSSQVRRPCQGPPGNVKTRQRYVLYSVVFSSSNRSKRFTLFALPDRPVHSDTNSASPGSILVMQHLRATTKSLTFPPPSIARYSSIQDSELGRRGENKNAQNLKQQQRGFEPGFSISCPAFYRPPETSSR